MAIVIMAIDKIDSFIATQIIKRLFQRQPESVSELQSKNQSPFQFVVITISHITRHLVVMTGQRYN